MKRIFRMTIMAALAFIAFAFVAGAAFAQQGWVQENSGTTQNLNAVSFPDTMTAYAVGNGGTIMKSTDGGATWATQTSGTTQNLLAVSFTNDSAGTVVGTGGTILRTVDGGATWNSQNSGTSQTLDAVSFVDENKGTAVGGGGTILHTTDGGGTWTAQSDSNTMSITGVALADANTGYITANSARNGFPAEYGYIFKTTDGGLAWKQVYQAADVYFNGIACGGTVYASAEGDLYGNLSMNFFRAFTSNAGSSWSNSSGYSNYAQIFMLNGSCYADSETEIAVGSYGGIYRGGTLQSSGTYSTLNGVAYANTNYGIVVGPGGLVLRTTNGGVAPPPVPTLTTPANGATNVATDPTLVFNSNWVTSYHVQISADTAFSKIVYDKSGYDPWATGAPETWPTSTNLSNATRYYWRAAASNSYGTSPWSQIWSFTTEGNPDLMVYNKALMSPWTDVSWGATVTYTDTNAISVAADAWGALSLLDGAWGAQDSVNPAKYTSLNFSFMGNQEFGAFLQTPSGDQLPCVDTTLSGSGWVDVSIPMSELDPNGNYVGRMTFQSDEGTPYQFYVRDLRFVGLGQSSIASKGVTPTTRVTIDKPKTFALDQNYPNPFNPTTDIRYELSAVSKVTLKIYDVLGREVATLVNGEQPAGSYTVTFDGSRLSSGIYFYRLTAGSHVFIKKMLELK